MIRCAALDASGRRRPPAIRASRPGEGGPRPSQALPTPPPLRGDPGATCIDRSRGRPARAAGGGSWWHRRGRSKSRRPWACADRRPEAPEPTGSRRSGPAVVRIWILRQAPGRRQSTSASSQRFRRRTPERRDLRRARRPLGGTHPFLRRRAAHRPTPNAPGRAGRAERGVRWEGTREELADRESGVLVLIAFRWARTRLQLRRDPGTRGETGGPKSRSRFRSKAPDRGPDGR